MKLRTCSECAGSMLGIHGKSVTCSTACNNARRTRLRHEAKPLKEAPTACPYCGAAIIQGENSNPRVTCGSAPCRWQHKKAKGVPRRLRLVRQMEEGWDIEALLDLRRMRLQREEEMSALRVMLQRCA